jgi:hypothetical protein
MEAPDLPSGTTEWIGGRESWTARGIGFRWRRSTRSVANSTRQRRSTRRPLRLAPRLREARVGLAVVLNAQGRIADAIRTLGSARADYPRDRDVLLGLAILTRDAGDTVAARRYARLLIDAHPQDVRAQELNGTDPPSASAIGEGASSARGAATDLAAVGVNTAPRATLPKRWQPRWTTTAARDVPAPSGMPRRRRSGLRRPGS